MPYILNLAYLVLLVVASPLLAYSAFRKNKYREGWGAKLLGKVPVRQSDTPCIWFHAVSVGEVNLLKPLLDLLRVTGPECECVISTTTKTGFDLARKNYNDHLVFYCPLDFSWAVRRAMKRIRPNVLVIAELEIWPNLIRVARESGAKVAIVNGRLSDKSFRGYRRFRWLFSATLKSIDVCGAQNKQYADRFMQLGIRCPAVSVTGSLKFDGAQTNRGNPTTQSLLGLLGAKTNDIVFLAGSTQSPEEAIALEVFNRLKISHPNLHLILVPRHPERFAEVAKLLADNGAPWQLRSKLELEGPCPEARILLVDSIGELGAWWGIADIAFVGGSMGSRGGQNMIEPAAYGAAVSFGPNTRNFRDVVAMMLEQRAAVVVDSTQSLESFVSRCLDSPEFGAELGKRAQSLVQQQLGAAERTIRMLKPLIEAEPRSLRRRVA
jgi:3-deoxy-D-manno-octulosonic-acid transferase